MPYNNTSNSQTNNSNSLNYPGQFYSTNTNTMDNTGNYFQNSNFEDQLQGGSSLFDPSSSRLEPTAQEFYPASYNISRTQRYGSGRLPSSTTFKNSYKNEQFGYSNQSYNSFPTETSTSSANFVPASSNKSNLESSVDQTNFVEPSGSHSKQLDLTREKNGYSKAYSKNRFENRSSVEETKRQRDFYRGASSGNLDKAKESNSFEDKGNKNTKSDASFSKNIGTENYPKTRKYPRNLVNELREETNEAQKTSGKSKGSNSKNKNKPKDHEENNFDYDSFPSGMAYGFRNKTRNNNYGGGSSRSSFDNSYRGRGENSYKNKGDNLYKGREDNSYKNRGDNSSKSREGRDDDFYKSRNDNSYKSREDNSYKNRGDNLYKNRENRDDDVFRTRDKNSYKNRADNSYKSRENRDDDFYKTRDDNSYKSYNSSSFKNRSDNSASKSRDNSRESSRENDYSWDSYDNSSGNGSNYRGGSRGKSSSNWRNKSSKYVDVKKDRHSMAAGQRERLIDMIDNRTLECLVCCEKIKTNDKVWSCMQCYHILHLNCISAWAKSSKVEDNWRCPACQNICSELPKQYNCYCGKVTDPKFDPNVIPHGCGEMCLRKGRNCEHKCIILCHPGPCPDCNIMVSKPCGCGKTSQTVKCSTELEIVCDAICGKTLECGIHECKDKCHIGPCPPCAEIIIQECHCGKTGRKMPCTSEYSGQTVFCCDNPCQKLLSCGNHRCEKACHAGDCGPCVRDVKIVNSCHCGKIPLPEERTSCLDPIPCCDKICGKILPCGQPSKPHSCQEKCHEGKCPPCPLTTVVRCRCGHMDKEMACQKLTTKADDARCEKKCNKKRLCGKHKCNQRCCIEVEHFCPLPCNHSLSCGLHRCERTCHSGRCPPCLESSFEELHCECGASVIYPPVPCGTKPPTCNEPCSKTRDCGHPPNHDCHSGPCPPCFVLTKRWCYGNHEQRATIPCHQENFGCGLPCGKSMPCGRHKCTKPCHEGECPMPCAQPCTVSRILCGHPCGKPCHDPPCPESYCRQLVPITCQCGLQKGSRPCTEVSDEFRNIEMAQLKEKMENMTVPDQTIDISDIVTKSKRPAVLKILECNDECKTLERNRRLAIGLQIRNPDLSQKLTPRYSDFMKQWAKKDPYFCRKVHDKLTELVQLAKQSKQKSRSHSFESMNRDKRHFIHEYAEHFGCESAAYDQEPNRNVVATAIKDKSWLPSFSLLEVIQRENGQRKVPGPILGSSSSAKSESVSMKVTSRAQKPAVEKSDPWCSKSAADYDENDRYFSNP